MISESILKKDLNEIKAFFGEETKNHALIRFIFLIIFVIGYFLFESYRFGAGEGLFVSILTWAFFVLCTPIADAGFLLAFPVRLLMGIRMIYTQIFAYFVAFGVVFYAFAYSSETFNNTMVLQLFHEILTTPWPYWLILVISFVGTIFSIVFGDELVDVSTHKDRKLYHQHKSKHRMVITAFIVLATFLLYYYLLGKTGITI